MDALSSLFPMHQIGSDGFSWWIGQVETPTYRNDGEKDPKRSGRYKVRIVGHHPKSCTAVPTADLPWAITMMPVTNPHIAGGHASVSDQLEEGVWVVGFFLDNEKQQPVIMGSIGRVAGSSDEETPSDRDPNECHSFKTFSTSACTGKSRDKTILLLFTLLNFLTANLSSKAFSTPEIPEIAA